MTSHLPSMSALRAFEAAVRLRSVSGAAQELRLTPGAISRALQDFEAAAGVTLFERQPRALQPTAAAERLAEDVRILFTRMEGALARARSAAHQLPVVISCEPSLLIRWLIPRLPSLQDWLGRHDIRFVSAGGPVPFARDGIDLALRRRDFAMPKTIIAEPFLTERIGPVCRPDIAAQTVPRGAMDEIVTLHTRTRADAWNTWSRQSGTAVRPARELTFEHFYLSLQAAVAGLGFAIGPVALVQDDLRTGTLAAPRGLVADGTDYVLMSDGNTAAKLFSKMLDWLRREMADTESM
ncbi:LysR family transcriptional regulator [Methylovirgula sp. 4M-Z18]|uniref:LysR family transcriptional regulator n=1 Tax=Methylovirgula sp. 4M-Z18 TaxID=2293567 RepID=UPI000E2FBD30|nr:LysR family transcriptional regulator [Methylovirgula sp. 4M-Z18]RFB81233.1 LysR family transcriptional regulator [Methylovirgula sp. 4M-Z18]